MALTRSFRETILEQLANEEFGEKFCAKQSAI
jgi:hypothetical protein